MLLVQIILCNPKFSKTLLRHMIRYLGMYLYLNSCAVHVTVMFVRIKLF